MKIFKATIAFTLIFSMLMSNVSAAGKYINLNLKYDGKNHNYIAEEVKLVVDGKNLTNLTMPPIIMNGYTLVPAREVFENLGAEVNWVAATEQVYVKYGEDVVMLQIDSKKAYVDGKPMEMSVAPKIINDKTMIPLRFASESIGMEVGWNSQTRVATVSKPKAVTTTTTTKDTTTTTETTTEVTTAAPKITRSGSPTKMNGYMSDSYSKVNIQSVYKAKDCESMFFASANGAISSVKVGKMSGNNVAVDIENAANAVAAGKYIVDDEKVESIEISEQAGSTPVTRLLFNMKKAGNFSLYLSTDRKTLGISTGTNTISSIDIKKLAGGDKLTITGSSKPCVETVTSTTGDLITIDVMDAVLESGKGELDEGMVISGGVYYQYNTNTVRISVDLKEKAGFTTDIKGNSISLTISDSVDVGLWNVPESSVRYDAEKGLVLPGAAGIISPDKVTHNDNYNDLNYTLYMNGNFGGLLTNQTVEINDGRVKNAEIIVGSGITTIKFNENRIMAVNVTASGSDLYLKPVLPKEKYSKIIVLDAGHGGTDTGAGCAGVNEKDLTLAMLQKTKALFDNSDIKCYATRVADVKPTFNERTDLANEGDAFVSIHINSVDSNSTASGTETFCQYANNLGNGLTSYILADRVLDKLLLNLGTVDRGVKSNDLIVLRNSKVPATLIEIGFITNASDRAMMNSEDGQNKVAKAVFDAVTELFNEYAPVR